MAVLHHKKSQVSNFFHVSTSPLLAMTFILVLQNRAHSLSKIVQLSLSEASCKPLNSSPVYLQFSEVQSLGKLTMKGV